MVPDLYIGELSQASIPLALDTAINASLKLSGVSDDSIKQRRNQVYMLIDNVKEHIKDIRSGKDKAEEVLHYLHDNLFRRYSVNQTRIDVIFDNGTFNCVSSAAIYLLCLRAINIPVWGIKTKDHAFCRIKTEDGDYDVETTNIYGFNPGVKKDFTDEFGNITGYSYVPPGHYSGRTEVSDLELLSLIIQNRITYLNQKNNYYEAFELAVDLYGLLPHEDTYNTLVALTGNMALWYTNKKEYEQGIIFFDKVMSMFPENTQLSDVRYKFLHNYIIFLLDRKMMEEAEQLVLTRNNLGLFEEKDFVELMIYIVLDKANLLSKQSFSDAIDLINASILLYGDDNRLIKIKNSLVTNWIASHINKKEWDVAERLVHSLFEKSEITRDQWKNSLSIIFNGQAVIIAKEQGNLEAAAYIKQCLGIIGKDKVLENNYNYYRYNYTATIHNQVIELVKEKKYTEAIQLLEEGLKNVEDSSLLKGDLEKVRKMMS
ncbi:MAG: hypothetical protein JXJ04_19635 [Spirochaetales bacterium]|nr:hypothetical protein [Spirochaetales bacterium]